MELSTNVSSLNLTDSSVVISNNSTTLVSSFNQSKTMYHFESIPSPGTTYTLFGLTCFIAILGLYCNFSILAFLSKMRAQLKGHDVLITFLAALDSLAITTVPFTQPYVYEVIGMDITAISSIGCKLFHSVFFSATYGSSLIVVLICIERFLVVWFPLRSRILLSPTTVRRCVLICLTPMVLAYCVTSVLYCELDEDGICNPNFDGSQFSTVLKKKPNTIIYNILTAIPSICTLVILPILTPLTIFKLFKHAASRRHLTTQEQDSRHYQASVKLTAVVVAQLTLVGLPACIGSFLILMDTDTKTDSDKNDLVLALITLALLLNHSMNFLLYNIFDRDFRTKALGLICFKKEQGHSNVAQDVSCDK